MSPFPPPEYTRTLADEFMPPADAGKVVSIIVHKGVVFVATEYAVFHYSDVTRKLIPLKFSRGQL